MQNQIIPGSLLAAMRADPPLVQCITNFVAMNIAANVMLAAGASPAMVHSEEEAGEFATISSALTINIGTLSPAWLAGMKMAARAATKADKPWVLDPVAHYATAYRRKAVIELLELRPTIIRGNASEIIALAGGVSRGQGVDSRDPVELQQTRPGTWPASIRRSSRSRARRISSLTETRHGGSKADRS